MLKENVLEATAEVEAGLICDCRYVFDRVEDILILDLNDESMFF
jgi:hypothetical protein